MFEPWRRYEPKMVARLFRQHSKLLRSELTTIKTLIAASAEPAIVNERIDNLWRRWRVAMTDIIRSAKEINRIIFMLIPVLKFTVVIRAQTQLLRTAMAVFDFLADRALVDKTR